MSEKYIKLTDAYWQENGKTAVIDKGGITLNNGKKETHIDWDDLCDAIQAASQCFDEGTRKHDDLFQVGAFYLPFLRKIVNK